MKDEKIAPEQVLASLFAGKSRCEQMALLSRLEHGGASIYRGWAKSERNAKAREALLEAADREEANARLLRVMSTPKEECEKCQKPLALAAEAWCCVFQCTFCPECAVSYNHVCPNCAGELTARRAA